MLIAAKRRYLLLSASEYNPSTQPAAVRRAPLFICREAATTTLRPVGPVKPKNPPAKGRSNLRTLTPQACQSGPLHILLIWYMMESS